MSRDQRILEILKQLQPIQINLMNDSAKHASHVEHLGSGGYTGETHYRLTMVSSLFEGASRIDRQRMIMSLLKDEFSTGLHALEIKALAPTEIKV